MGREEEKNAADKMKRRQAALIYRIARSILHKKKELSPTAKP